jgi:hypothetical protein
MVRTFGGMAMLRPLAIRDFALLWTGMTVSFVGDGIFFVAIAWQVYAISNVPTALSFVFAAMTVPQVLFLLLGGVLSDRFERQKVMIAADLIRGVAVAAIGALAVSDALELWHAMALVALYGAGEALFGPAFGSIVPDLVPRDLLIQANSLHQFVRPFTLRLIGPALGGWLVATVGTGTAFLIDAGSFAVSASALAAMASRPRPRPPDSSLRAALAEVREGFRFVRSQTWLWGTLLAAAVALLVFYGPWEVLLPYIVKNELGGSAADVGLAFAAGGAGSMLAALLVGSLGLPRRHTTFMYLVWSIGTLPLVVYGVASALWQVLAAAFVAGGTGTAGMVVWATLMHRHVPTELLGRVSSVDWFVSISLIPVSFALTGPIAEAAGTTATLVGAGLLGTVSTFLFLFLPGMRDLERADDEDKIR